MNADGERLLELSVPARADQLRVLRDAVRECLELCGASAECTVDVVMAVDEACQNIIRHAYRGDPDGTIDITIDLRPNGDLVFRIVDHAPTIDPSRVKPRDLDDVRPGGLGTHLIREVMDEAGFEAGPSGDGNLLRMVKRIH